MRKCIQCNQTIQETIHIYNLFKPPQIFCERCETLWLNSKIHKDGRCPKCLNNKISTDGECHDCQFLSKTFYLMEQLFCDYSYDGVMKEIIHQYKIMRDFYLAEVLAKRLDLPQTQYDYIVPIPSPIERDIERTFNPVTTVLDKMGISYQDVLGTHIRPKQSKLGKVERSKASNPFYIKDEDINIEGKVILLIDDIYTTGLTIHHAGCKLYDKKVRKFKVFAFAR